MTRPHLLVVDDEPLNLEIIKEYLDDTEYEAVFVESGDAAWSRLETTETPFELVILDRMMPGMNGMELLRRMKADARFRDIPVVMQTAASTPDQVREGIEAGAYYYLAKPYQPETLAAIVRAALHDVVMRKTAVRRASDHVRAMSMLDRAEFRFRRLDEIGTLLEVLTGLCPAPEVAAIGLSELLINAVEHGNLGISYADKRQLRLRNSWEDEVARRQELPEYRDHWVRVRIVRHADRVEFGISDEGGGFDWRRYLEIDPERASDPNGRGIAMARMLSFDSLEYRGSGSLVVVTVRTAPL